MKWVLGVAGVLTVGAALGFWAQSGQGAQGLPYQDATAIRDGAVLYARNCASCHGADLEGQANWKQRGADGYLPAPPHDPTGHTWHHPVSQLVAITQLGTEKMVGGGYKSRMSGFQPVLSDDQIIAILAYIKSTWPQDVIDAHNQINAKASQ